MVYSRQLEQPLILRLVDQEKAARLNTEIEPLEQAGLGRVGDDQLAVGMADVGRQFSAPPGGIDPDDGGAGQGRPSDPEEILGHVFQEHADVIRAAIGVTQREGDGGARLAGGRELGVGVRLILEEDGGVRVMLTSEDEVGDGRHAVVFTSTR